MISLIITESNEVGSNIKKRIQPYGFRCIHYKSALKALDNIPEIQPELIFINTADFPRHWKTIAQFVRGENSKEETVIILLHNDRFTEDDAAKALHIGIQAIVHESFERESDSKQLADIFSRYKSLQIESPNFIIDPNPEELSFLFTHPITKQIITGSIKTLSTTTIEFYVDTPVATQNLKENSFLEGTIGIHDSIIPITCMLEKNSTYLLLQIKKIKEEDIALLEKFISGNTLNP